MARSRQIPEGKRRIPRQSRAAATVAAIVEAATQVLEAGGLPHFTTNAVAERAGVSIGTLYQYFADKNALLHAIAEQEVKSTLGKIGTLLASESGPPDERVRAVVRAIINAFRGRQRARKAVVQAVFSDGAGARFQAPIAAFIAVNALKTLDEVQTFVLSRAILGAIRSAVLEEHGLLKSRSFEDELVRLTMAYLGTLNALPAGRR
jgi:AcrR family transcriptional regulator